MTLSSCSPYAIRSCLWGIPAFCGPPSVILNPACTKQECLEFQDICGLMGADIYTDDIWESQQLQGWARSDRSSLLMIQGGYESVNRLERFAAKLWEHLDSKQPTVAILQSPVSTDFFDGFDERELLRQIALQALRKVSPARPICFLADIVHLLIEASTCEDWFRILEKIFEMFPSLIVIITVTVLEERAERTTTWPIQIEGMMARLQNRSTCLKVILIATHQLWFKPETPSLLWVSPAPEIDSDDEMGGINGPSEHYLPLSFSVPFRKRPGQEIFETSEVTQDGIISNQPEQHTSTNEAPKVRRPESLQQSSSPSHPTQIDIVILCALTLEADAVESLFDGQWTGGYNRSEGDTNTYTLGVIGRHGVALVHMPGMGTTYSATVATVATCCRSTFPGISLALVVGICGGVPFPPNAAELLLGDVVISDGLVRYDFARQYPDGCLIRSSVSESTRKLPAEVLGYLAKLKF
ncbi:pfs domain-containing protein [Fusarium circinatum]|uniref:Pfs domain-containing protein n=1 Tax=Fusarium circinatum TaxID=48490 RepID=A0A8H5UHY0_FUSCI|nr:pfs domain-containing protein [Fusarium circinatum]